MSKSAMRKKRNQFDFFSIWKAFQWNSKNLQAKARN